MLRKRSFSAGEKNLSKEKITVKAIPIPIDKIYQHLLNKKITLEEYVHQLFLMANGHAHSKIAISVAKRNLSYLKNSMPSETWNPQQQNQPELLYSDDPDAKLAAQASYYLGCLAEYLTDDNDSPFRDDLDGAKDAISLHIQAALQGEHLALAHLQKIVEKINHPSLRLRTGLKLIAYAKDDHFLMSIKKNIFDEKTFNLLLAQSKHELVAQYALGQCYRLGIHVEKDISQAVLCFSQTINMAFVLSKKKNFLTSNSLTKKKIATTRALNLINFLAEFEQNPLALNSKNEAKQAGSPFNYVKKIIKQQIKKCIQDCFLQLKNIHQETRYQLEKSHYKIMHSFIELLEGRSFFEANLILNLCASYNFINHCCKFPNKQEIVNEIKSRIFCDNPESIAQFIKDSQNMNEVQYKDFFMRLYEVFLTKRMELVRVLYPILTQLKLLTQDKPRLHVKALTRLLAHEAGVMDFQRMIMSRFCLAQSQCKGKDAKLVQMTNLYLQGKSHCYGVVVQTDPKIALHYFMQVVEILLKDIKKSDAYFIEQKESITIFSLTWKEIKLMAEKENYHDTKVYLKKLGISYQPLSQIFSSLINYAEKKVDEIISLVLDNHSLDGKLVSLIFDQLSLIASADFAFSIKIGMKFLLHSQIQVNHVKMLTLSFFNLPFFKLIEQVHACSPHMETELFFGKCFELGIGREKNDDQAATCYHRVINFFHDTYFKLPKNSLQRNIYEVAYERLFFFAEIQNNHKALNILAHLHPHIYAHERKFISINQQIDMEVNYLVQELEKIHKESRLQLKKCNSKVMILLQGLVDQLSYFNGDRILSIFTDYCFIQHSVFLFKKYQENQVSCKNLATDLRVSASANTNIRQWFINSWNSSKKQEDLSFKKNNPDGLSLVIKNEKFYLDALKHFKLNHEDFVDEIANILNVFLSLEDNESQAFLNHLEYVVAVKRNKFARIFYPAIAHLQFLIQADPELHMQVFLKLMAHEVANADYHQLVLNHFYHDDIFSRITNCDHDKLFYQYVLAQCYRYGFVLEKNSDMALSFLVHILEYLSIKVEKSGAAIFSLKEYEEVFCLSWKALHVMANQEGNLAAQAFLIKARLEHNPLCQVYHAYLNYIYSQIEEIISLVNNNDINYDLDSRKFNHLNLIMHTEIECAINIGLKFLSHSKINEQLIRFFSLAFSWDAQLLKMIIDSHHHHPRIETALLLAKLIEYGVACEINTEQAALGYYQVITLFDALPVSVKQDSVNKQYYEFAYQALYHFAVHYELNQQALVYFAELYPRVDLTQHYELSPETMFAIAVLYEDRADLNQAATWYFRLLLSCLNEPLCGRAYQKLLLINSQNNVYAHKFISFYLKNSNNHTDYSEEGFLNFFEQVDFQKLKKGLNKFQEKISLIVHASMLTPATKKNELTIIILEELAKKDAHHAVSYFFPGSCVTLLAHLVQAIESQSFEKFSKRYPSLMSSASSPKLPRIIR